MLGDLRTEPAKDGLRNDVVSPVSCSHLFLATVLLVIRRSPVPPLILSFAVYYISQSSLWHAELCTVDGKRTRRRRLC